MQNDRDEGRVRVGTRGHVRYLPRLLPNGLPTAVTVTEIRVDPRSGQLLAACDDGSGDIRVFPVDEIMTDYAGEAYS